MAKKLETEQDAAEEILEETEQAADQENESAEVPEAAAETGETEVEQLKKSVAQKEDQYLRLLAEYDNFRKRSAKEKESAWTDAKSETAAAFLPVYDNLERALKAPCADEAFLKGVEMTMDQLKDVLAKLGIEEIPALGEKFDPACHNAVMHVDDEQAEENTVVEVFQTGFQTGGKVIRFSMVKVAN